MLKVCIRIPHCRMQGSSPVPSLLLVAFVTPIRSGAYLRLSSQYYNGRKGFRPADKRQKSVWCSLLSSLAHSFLEVNPIQLVVPASVSCFGVLLSSSSHIRQNRRFPTSLHSSILHPSFVYSPFKYLLGVDRA